MWKIYLWMNFKVILLGVLALDLSCDGASLFRFLVGFVIIEWTRFRRCPLLIQRTAFIRNSYARLFLFWVALTSCPWIFVLPFNGAFITPANSYVQFFILFEISECSLPFALVQSLCFLIEVICFNWNSHVNFGVCL